MRDRSRAGAGPSAGAGAGAGAATGPGKVPRTARLQRRAAAPPAADPEGAVARAASSAGAPLPDDVRTRFEASTGAELGDVRVHTGPESASAAAAVGARAYATGDDIHFAAGAFAPADPDGLHLLAHEVAHTQQQRGGAPARQARLEVSGPGDAAELAADHAADAMVRGAPAAIAPVAAAPAIAREPGHTQVQVEVGPEPFGDDLTNAKGAVRGDVTIRGDLDVADQPDGGVSAQDRGTRAARGAWDRARPSYAIQSIDVGFAGGAPPAGAASGSAHVQVHLGQDVVAGDVAVTAKPGAPAGTPPYDAALAPFDLAADRHVDLATQVDGIQVTGPVDLHVRAQVSLDAGAFAQALAAAAPTPTTTPDPNAPAPPSPEEAAQLAAFAAEAAAAAQAMDDAGHTQGGLAAEGSAPTGTGSLPGWFMGLQKKLVATTQWGPEEERAQGVLQRYLGWYTQKHGGAPPNVQVLFNYAGRSANNDDAARKAGDRGTSHFGGSRGAPNWCTSTSTTAVVDGLASLGYVAEGGALGLINTLRQVAGASGTVYGEAAYAAPLLPGDMVMFLFDRCQYGGHTVTVVEDQGDSFMHVSGNAGSAGVGAGVARRLKTPPRGFALGNATKVATPADQQASSQYIARFDFGGAVLTYSIVHYGIVFTELGTLATTTDPGEEARIMAKYHLRKLNG